MASLAKRLGFCFLMVIFLTATVILTRNFQNNITSTQNSPLRVSLIINKTGQSLKGDLKSKTSKQDQISTPSHSGGNVSRVLVTTLTERIRAVQSKGLDLKPTCQTVDTLADSCQGGADSCLRKELPTDVGTRIGHLVNNEKLKLSESPLKVLQKMRQKIKRHYDVILVSGVSSNHYREAQGMIKSVHDHVLPVLKNFTFLFYDLGLSSTKRRQLTRFCKCKVLDFPFKKFPKFVKTLGCFSWKPVIIKAHAQQANVLIWADSSIRFHADPTHLNTVIERTRQRGLQVNMSPGGQAAFRTLRDMYHFFGDEPCAYLEMWEASAGLGFYSNDQFVDRAILEPWMACGLNEKCMCNNARRVQQVFSCTASINMANAVKSHKGKIRYGMCHRFDQSAISLILHKLYKNHYQWVMIDMRPYIDIRRDHIVKYFSSLGG